MRISERSNANPFFRVGKDVTSVLDYPIFRIEYFLRYCLSGFTGDI